MNLQPIIKENLEMNMKSIVFAGMMCLLFLSFTTKSFGQQTNHLEGRWDLTLKMDGKDLPSWLEVRHSGIQTYVGRYVFANGSARPISEVKIKDSKFSFAIPPQWEQGNKYLEFDGMVENDKLTGSFVYTDGKKYNFTGVKAPKLEYTANPTWGEPITLFNGRDLEGWTAMGENQWEVEKGVLKSSKSGSNLVSDQKFMDFKLHIEFRYPEESNSGIYLRGRYEVQIADNIGLEPSDVLFAGVYGFLSPNEMLAKNAGVWQSFDITLIGRRITIIANGIEVITDQVIPGITGGALDSHEGEPGPFLIQGDHGAVEFRNIIVTPRVEK